MGESVGIVHGVAPASLVGELELIGRASSPDRCPILCRIKPFVQARGINCRIDCRKLCWGSTSQTCSAWGKNARTARAFRPLASTGCGPKIFKRVLVVALKEGSHRFQRQLRRHDQTPGGKTFA